MKGHIKITKVYDDHQEVVIDESNILTEGFKVDVVSVLMGEATQLPSICPGYFQIGTDVVGYEFYATSPIQGYRHASSVFFQLSSPLTTVNEYGVETPLKLRNLHRSFIASALGTGDGAYGEIVLSGLVPGSPWRDPFEASALTTSATEDREWFIALEPQHLTKFFLDSLNIRLEIDKKTANGIALKEFGLFTKSALSYKEDRPLLCAYKKLSSAITKRPSFKLFIDWNIGFIGNSNIYDNITPGFR